MPRKERGEHVPEAIAFHGFNNNTSQPPTEEVDILHIAKQLSTCNLLTSTDVIKVAVLLHAMMVDKVFIVENRRYKVVKVFSAGDTCIKMRVELVSFTQSEETDMKAC